MATDIDFRPNRAAIQRLRTSPGVQAFTISKARELVRVIQANAPIEEGDYKRSWRVMPLGGTSGAVLVYTNDYKAWWIEYGTRPHGEHPGTAAHHTMYYSVQLMAVDE